MNIYEGGVMSETKPPIRPEPEELVACEICLKEIPASAAKHEEAQDYVVHFCGIDCFDKWKENRQTE